MKIEPAKDTFDDDVRAALDEIAARIPSVLAEVREMLISKNAAYGNSALDPLRIFSKAAPDSQILTRIDDKLSRIARGNGTETEDVEADLVGYLVILRIARARVAREAARQATAAEARSPDCTCHPDSDRPDHEESCSFGRWVRARLRARDEARS